MARGWAYGFTVAGVTLAACGPVPVEVAERQCLNEVRPVAPVSGEGAMGVTSEGFRSKMELTFTLGSGGQGDPSARYNACVKRKSGRMPTRPLYARTDWKG
ncbi:hypothetical protein C8J27_103385 [Rhodobacter aestuarii]|uniref:Lipoprotein n=1 Tax=Rhodobacter aestuarii TaxID=453582 RepID=A0A1N7JNP6_9RHOB|nr:MULTISPECIES: hypothetical protein [Rhodobacter]PTV96053.1 hypothetical protein C8J27_103385 [Rhodobacter aestuarii]SIS50983.1 hypothetical protein SAMN05421580_10250 [Rhodobacter aestuarii]SOC10002.1 hypothetical protein SAMN05877809_10548 [Rhodobacter sp. JA431]